MYSTEYLKKLIYITGLVNFMIFGLFGCKTATLVFFEHEASKTFYSNYDIDAESLAPFVDNGTALIVSAKATQQRSKYAIWLALYSKSKSQTVKVNKVTLRGENISEQFMIDSTVSLDSMQEGTALFYKNIRVSEVSNELINKASENENIYLIVDYAIGGSVNSKTFKLERRIEKQSVYPT